MAGLTTDLMYRALPYIYNGTSIKKFIANNPVPDEVLDDFELFWYSVAYDVEHSDPNTQWDVPHEWVGGE